MPHTVRFLRTVVVLLITLLCVTAARADVVLSAAISLQSALEQAHPALEKAAGDKVTFNFGASGTLARQIEQGAPVDLFISADRATVDRLVADKAAPATSVTVIAGNTLVLIEPTSSTLGLKSFADLPKVKRLAIGEPKVVPAGAYAKQVLSALKLWESLDKAGKLVTCENVAQVLTLVNRGEVDAGLVYRTDLAAAKNVHEVAAADPTLHDKIEYVSAIPVTAKNKSAAEKLQGALGSKEVKEILQAKGFTTP